MYYLLLPQGYNHGGWTGVIDTPPFPENYCILFIRKSLNPSCQINLDVKKQLQDELEIASKKCKRMRGFLKQVEFFNCYNQVPGS